ncbi:LOW QUALITY PROTEIN: hypothetical protein ColTof3_00739 [Colletotrichum tofieldiae]|nr:LOW QUALITY PROTEIN: hypothetical protein ColTof3_00739 [Colletotrichum tofieldiae]
MPRRLNNHTASAPLYKAAKHLPTNRQTLLGHLPFPRRPSSSSPYRPRIPPILLPVDRPAQRAVVERDAPPQQHPEDLRPPRPPYDLLVAHDPADLVPEEVPERVRLGVVLEPGRARPAAGPRLGTVISGGHVFPQDLLEAVHAHPERQPLRLGPVDQPNQPAGPLPHPPPPPPTPPSRPVAVLARRVDQDVVRYQVPVGDHPRQRPLYLVQLPIARATTPRNSPGRPSARTSSLHLKLPPTFPLTTSRPSRRPLQESANTTARSATTLLRHARGSIPSAADSPRNCVSETPPTLSNAYAHSSPSWPLPASAVSKPHAQLLDAGHGPAAEHAPRLRADPDVDAVPPRPELHQQAAPPLDAGRKALRAAARALVTAAAAVAAAAAAATPIVGLDPAVPSPPAGRRWQEEQRVRAVPLERRRRDLAPREPRPREAVRRGDGGGLQPAPRQERRDLLVVPPLACFRGG